MENTKNFVKQNEEQLKNSIYAPSNEQVNKNSKAVSDMSTVKNDAAAKTDK